MDRFYAEHGYGAHRLLVRLPVERSGPAPRAAGYEVRETREVPDEGVRKYYLAAPELDQDRLEDIRRNLVEDAIYVVRKRLDER